ncbi:MAG TPA: hypothetical protein VGM92_11140, partial [Candidatus Kapabacteria bacterium]
MKSILFLCIVFSSAAAFGQWEQLSGPYGGGANAFVQSSKTGLIYAATPNGLYVSRDRAQSWEPKGLQGVQVTNLLVLEVGDTETLFASASNYTGLDSLYRSTDSGNSWSAVFGHIPDPFDSYENKIISLLQKGSSLYLVLDGWQGIGLGGIFRSNDLGTTWTLLAQPPDSTAITAAVISGDYIVALFDNMVWRIPDTGGTWERSVHDTLGGTAFTQVGGALQTEGDTLFAVVDSLYRSTDNGATWQ